MKILLKSAATVAKRGFIHCDKHARNVVGLSQRFSFRSISSSSSSSLLTNNNHRSCCYSCGCMMITPHMGCCCSVSHNNVMKSTTMIMNRSMSTSAAKKMDDLKTGTAAYMDLYPEQSTDGALRLGNIVPDFACETTHGYWESFHEWKKGKWAILFSHPADFTPVCTTEIGRLALKYDELQQMDCLVATLSVDPVKSHTDWLQDVVAHCENKIEVKFPIIGDADRSISTAYGMLDEKTSAEQELPLTIRAVFIINPENKLMLSLNYPACVGRNMDEIVRCVKALQLSYERSIATPANWPNNHEEVLMSDGTHSKDYKGSVFLLPTVSEEEAKERYPNYHTCDVPSKIPYLRLVKASDVK